MSSVDWLKRYKESDVQLRRYKKMTRGRIECLETKTYKMLSKAAYQHAGLKLNDVLVMTKRTDSAPLLRPGDEVTVTWVGFAPVYSLSKRVEVRYTYEDRGVYHRSMTLTPESLWKHFEKVKKTR